MRCCSLQGSQRHLTHSCPQGKEGALLRDDRSLPMCLLNWVVCAAAGSWVPTTVNISSSLSLSKSQHKHIAVWRETETCSSAVWWSRLYCDRGDQLWRWNEWAACSRGKTLFWIILCSKSFSLSLSISRSLLLWLLSLKAVVRNSHCELDEGVETNWKQKKKKKKRERCAFYGSELPMRMIRHKWCFPKAPSRRIQRGARDGGVFSFILDISASFRCFFFYSRLEKEIVHQSPLILSYSRRREFFYHC